jgi:FixJ family two-component response regulator
MKPRALRAQLRSSSSTMTTSFASRYAPCSKTTAASSNAMEAARAFLKAFDPGKSACLLVDAYLPGMSGLELLENLHHDGHSLLAIMITGNADVPMTVQAKRAGALDFIEKPIGR